MNQKEEINLLREIAFLICAFTIIIVCALLVSKWFETYGEVIFYIPFLLPMSAYFVWVFYYLFIPESKEKQELEKKIKYLKEKYPSSEARDLKEKELRAEYKLNKIRNEIKEFKSIT